jgi:glycosyltransferase involved in cell wall biosynthesis
VNFLSRLPRTPEVEAALLGADQDLRALKGEIDLAIPHGTRYEPAKGVSLYLLHNSLPEKSGGYSTRSHGLLTGLQSHDIDAIPVTRPGFPAKKHVFDQDPDTPELHVIDGIPYHRLLGPVTAQPRSDLQGFVDLYSDMLQPLIDRYRPSVIHAASNWWNGFAGVATAARHGIPSVYEIRGLWELTRASRQESWYDSERYQADANYETIAANMADRVIVITEGLRQEMEARGVPGDKITVVPNAVNLAEFTKTDRDRKLAAELDLENRCVIGFAGSLTFYEGLDDLLKAGASIAGKTQQPFSFLFVGDGPVWKELQELAAELGIGHLCRFPGRVPHSEVSRYLSLMDITPFPRIPIPVCEVVSPLKPLESMAMGVTVLASDVQALKEMVPPGAGLTFEKGNVESLAERLALLIDSPELRSQLAANAYDWVSENRSWDRVATSIQQIYGDLTE